MANNLKTTLEAMNNDIVELKELVEEVANDMCDGYCKFPHQCQTEEELMEHCDNCPLDKLV